MDKIMKEIILSDTITEDDYRIIKYNNKIIRDLGLYLILDKCSNIYIFIDVRLPILKDQVLVMDATIKTQTSKLDDTFQSLVNTLTEKERHDCNSYRPKKRKRT
uniref:Uncharacterized protein n=1 Tax=Penaeus monodon nucleopolyhedrovirus TaxID=259389 RepID=A9LME6_9BACU|nr:hypothetical protein [Penaeus monodon nucleopolyhedrovirus]